MSEPMQAKTTTAQQEKENSITIEIDGRPLQAQPGAMLIHIADEAGIPIPRFCYHKKLSVAANCRMCLVDVERAAKPLPACATPVAEGMKVWTRSEKARSAQQDVMAFLLINHPLDCPICDQGGECELQDVALAYGRSQSLYQEDKRVVSDQDIGPLVATEMTRCIHCTRCVRFGEEVAGLRELGATGRGESMAIGTFVAKSMVSELSGNVIDLCPVGALTAKPSRYRARAWEMRAAPSIAPHDALGSNIELHVFRNELIRTVPQNNEALNECWLSDRDRFSYQAVHSTERLLQPAIKTNGQWQTVSWQDALQKVSDILCDTPPKEVGGLASPQATLEELFLFQKLLRALDIRNIDHRLSQVDFSDQAETSAAPFLGLSLPELERQQRIVLVGADPRQEQPMLNYRLRKAVLAGGNVSAINPYAVDFNYPVQQAVMPPAEMVSELAGLLSAVAAYTEQPLPEAVQQLCQTALPAASSHEALQLQARQLCTSEKSVVLLGAMALQHPNLSHLRALAFAVCELSGAVLGYLPEAVNTVGAHLVGVLPHRGMAMQKATRQGLDTQAMLKKPLSAYLLLQAELEDFADPSLAMKALMQAEHVVFAGTFASERIREQASVLLPVASFAETDGTYINAQGEWQSFKAAIQPPEQARPSWKIWRVLGNQLQLPEFDYMSAQELSAELKLDLQDIIHGTNRYNLTTTPSLQNTVFTADMNAADSRATPSVKSLYLQRIGDMHMYRSDMLVRRATALQQQVQPLVVSLNPHDTATLDLSGETVLIQPLPDRPGEQVTQKAPSLEVKWVADSRIPVGCARLQAGYTTSVLLGMRFGGLSISGL